MDWRTIGKSYTPQVEEKRSITPPDSPRKKQRIPEYSRFPFIVGIDEKRQKDWIDQRAPYSQEVS
ncbi:hypothetical protein BEWA_002230 [Theileria equi strain WA]|uniref:Uncharacterized protein n=1 Tax=Theileria equi strain WA TaxID=1537102 RepID=L0B0M5_THEEQ|nr:hypothetical protein BEWA_002230 [Theileria equi strain WA]AFZ80816.1 hypothetical protein BEWA_002230 [Theileria equi strain WA]|eukprot:XP_004830482.1 hypothetical protein BEWA_002230 [Theileria equi strain WA]